MQAVCDHCKRYLSFDVRPGSWSDAKTFQHSSFGRNIDRLLPSVHHVLADSGYGVAPAVMTPYGDDGGTLTAIQASFNFYLSSTRMAIEGALGLLKQRFRIFKKPLDERSPTASVRIAVACMVLNNIFIDFKDTTSIPSGLLNSVGESEDEGGSVQLGVARDRTLRTKLGKQKRDDIAKLLAA